METVSAYLSSGEEEAEEVAPQPLAVRVDMVPNVDVAAATEMRSYVNPNTKQLMINPTHEALSQPVQGPQNPFQRNGRLSKPQMNLANGQLSVAGINAYSFDEQYHTFDTCGFASNPSTLDDARSSKLVGSAAAARERDGATVWGGSDKNRNKKRKKDLEASEWFDPNKDVMDELTDEQKEWVAEQESKREAEKVEAAKKKTDGVETFETKTIFHGTELRDYQGRSFVDPPSDLPPAPDKSYLPKKCIHTWTGHTKQVQAIRFFPKTAHLLLSASYDCKVKIWNVNGDRKCMRTYIGHSKAVRDICFTNDGRRFLSCGFDRYTKLWDTETGQCIGSYTTKKIPYCCKFNPMDESQNEFLVGQADKKIIQWAISDDKIVQEYDQHLAGVNSITFTDGGRRFMTSSDDKSLRVWEYGIPVVMKYLNEPWMHSMPAVTMSPNGKWLACQSMDNSIMVYDSARYRLNKKKRFQGHVVAGYACQPAWSNDCNYLLSGDGEGKLVIWDWKSKQIYKTLRAHNDGPCIGCVPHPLEASKFATCGWDGLIKYWD